MPNVFAYVALLAWPVAVYFLFQTLRRADALTWSIIGGYLVLPFGVEFDLSGIPGLPALVAVDKTLIPSLSAAVVLLLSLGLPEEPTGQDGVRRQAHRIGRRPGYPAKSASTASVERRSLPPSRKKSASRIESALLLLSLATPALTVALNAEPVPAGAALLPGLGLSDFTLMVTTAAAALLPYLLARRFLAGEAEHLRLLFGLSIAGLIYTLPTLFEIRMSPQLSRWVYGFLFQPFDQAIRDGGFRPVVFLQHGIWLATFLATSVLASIALWRQRSRASTWFGAAAWLLTTLLLCRSLGAVAIVLLLLPVAILMSARWQIIVACAIAAAFLAYPALRSMHLVPLAEISSLAESINEDRARSFDFRLANEDLLLARAAEKPFAGWGGWGRYRIYDEQTGADTAIADGIWIITIGTSGWLGYVAQYGLLTLPIFSLALRGRGRSISFATAGLCLTVAANLIDMVPNASLTPVTWLIAGALMGMVRQLEPRPSAAPRTANSRNASLQPPRSVSS